MRDIATKADGSTSLAAGDWNANQSELENTVTTSDQSLDPAGGADTDLNMLPKAIAGYAGASWAYTESGAANAHVASIASNLKPPSKYFDNLMVAYVPGNANTSTTVTVNVSSLGAKNIRVVGGGLPPVGAIKADRALILKFNDGADYFEIVKGVIDDHDHSAVDSEGGLISTPSIEITGSPSGTPDGDTLYKENIPKVIVNWDATGGFTVNFSFNVSSITDNGVGDFTVNFDRDFADTGYVTLPGGGGAGAGGYFPVTDVKVVGSIDIFTKNAAAAFTDFNDNSIACYGDQ